MKELKLKIFNIENVVLMKVLEQDESLIGKGYIYKAKNGIDIASSDSPCIYETDIFINGDDIDFDNKLNGLRFKTTQEAIEYIRKVKEAVAEYNESIKEILYEEEKEYLRGVIKPFRDKVEYIRKVICYFNRKEYIEIKVDEEYTQLPSFKVGTMYKGMEIDRKYTLKELGL